MPAEEVIHSTCKMQLGKVSGSHSGDYEYNRLLGYYTM
jgi:hypothetical protein